MAEPKATKSKTGKFMKQGQTESSYFGTSTNPTSKVRDTPRDLNP